MEQIYPIYPKDAALLPIEYDESLFAVPKSSSDFFDYAEHVSVLNRLISCSSKCNTSWKKFIQQEIERRARQHKVKMSDRDKLFVFISPLTTFLKHQEQSDTFKQEQKDTDTCRSPSVQRNSIQDPPLFLSFHPYIDVLLEINQLMNLERVHCELRDLHRPLSQREIPNPSRYTGEFALGYLFMLRKSLMHSDKTIAKQINDRYQYRKQVVEKFAAICMKSQKIHILHQRFQLIVSVQTNKKLYDNLQNYNDASQSESWNVQLNDILSQAIEKACSIVSKEKEKFKRYLKKDNPSFKLRYIRQLDLLHTTRHFQQTIDEKDDIPNSSYFIDFQFLVSCVYTVPNTKLADDPVLIFSGSIINHNENTCDEKKNNEIMCFGENYLSQIPFYKEEKIDATKYSDRQSKIRAAIRKRNKEIESRNRQHKQDLAQVISKILSLNYGLLFTYDESILQKHRKSFFSSSLGD